MFPYVVFAILAVEVGSYQLYIASYLAKTCGIIPGITTVRSTGIWRSVVAQLEYFQKVFLNMYLNYRMVGLTSAKYTATPM